jgi:hypothetical protein
MQGEQQATTLDQKINIIQNITLFPALTIVIFLRRKVGFRFLDMMKIQIMAVLLWGYAAFSSITFGPAAGAIIFLFSLAVLIAAFVERRLRWRDIKRGVPWHSYSRGVSWFSSFLPLREIIVRRFIDPAAALVIGIALFFLFRPLGFYLIVCAVCLFLFETIDYQRQIDRMLDQLDNLVESEVVSENVEYFQSGGVAKERPVEQTAGIPTGTDPDLAAAIARRRARNRGSQAAQVTTQTKKREPEQSVSRPLMRDSDIIGSQYPPQDFAAEPQEEEAATDIADAIKRRRAQSRQQISTEPPATTIAIQTRDIQSQEGVPIIKSPDDPAFMALPSGAEFMTPDGKTRRKK